MSSIDHIICSEDPIRRISKRATRAANKRLPHLPPIDPDDTDQEVRLELLENTPAINPNRNIDGLIYIIAYRKALALKNHSLPTRPDNECPEIASTIILEETHFILPKPPEIQSAEERLRSWADAFLGVKTPDMEWLDQQRKAIFQTYQRCPAITRIIVYRHYFEDRIGQEIADEMGLALNTVHKHLSRFRLACWKQFCKLGD